MDWFLYDNGLRREGVKAFLFLCDQMFSLSLTPISLFIPGCIRTKAIVADFFTALRNV